VIRREFAVSLSVVSVGRLLREPVTRPRGRPLWRAYQQNPDAVEQWKTETFPAIRAQAKKTGRRSTSSTRPDCGRITHAGTTWAPVGHTSVVATTGARHTINLISAITAYGESCCTTPPARSTSSWTVTPRTEQS
jgi:hypothetical protein